MMGSPRWLCAGVPARAAAQAAVPSTPPRSAAPPNINTNNKKKKNPRSVCGSSSSASAVAGGGADARAKAAGEKGGAAAESGGEAAGPGDCISSRISSMAERLWESGACAGRVLDVCRGRVVAVVDASGRTRRVESEGDMGRYGEIWGDMWDTSCGK